MLNFPFVCRLCLVPTSANTSIEIFDGTDEIPEKILELTDIQILMGDGLPQEVCGVCLHHLDLCVTFKRQISQADLMLREHLASTQEDKRCATPVIIGDPLTEEGRKEKPPVEEEEKGEAEKDEEAKTKPSDGNSNCESLNDVAAVKEKEADWAIAEPWPALGDSEVAKGGDIEVERTEDNSEYISTENEEVKKQETRIPITHIKLEGGGTLLFSLSEEEQDPDDHTNTSVNDLDLSCSDVNEESQKEFKCPHCPKAFASQRGVGGHQREHPEHRKPSRRRDRKRARDRNRKRARDRNRTRDRRKSGDKKNENKVLETSENNEINDKNVEKITKEENFSENIIQSVEQSNLNEGGLEMDQQKDGLQQLETVEQKDGLPGLEIGEQKDGLRRLEMDEQKDGLRRSSRSTLGKAPLRHVVPHYSCTKCERMYNDEVTLENHKKMHHGMTYKCNHCGKKFALKDSLESHIKVHLRDLGTIKNEITCPQEKLGKNNNQPQKRNHGQSRSRVRSRRNHVPPGRKSAHECNICGKSYENRSHLFFHMRSHKSTVHLCEICGKTVSLNTYPAHKRAHQNAESHEVFSCDLCGKKFNNKISLRTHKNSYHGTLKFTCEVCGKQFTTMALMRHHQNVHSGKRDHACQLCGRAFTLKVTLKSHMRIHTGEMPYGCENCGKHFTWKTTYRNHVATCKKMPNDVQARSEIVTQISGYAPPSEVARSEVLRPNNMYVSPPPQPPSPPPLPPPANIPNPYVPHLPQELPLDYSEEAKYHAPIDYREESKYRFLPITIPDTKGFPSVLNLREDIKYPYQQPLNFSGDVKLYKDVKSPM